MNTPNSRSEVADHIDQFVQLVRTYFQWNQIEGLNADALQRNNDQLKKGIRIDDGGETEKKIIAANGNRNQARADFVKLSKPLVRELAAHGIDTAPIHKIVELAESGGGPPEVSKVWSDIRAWMMSTADKLRTNEKLPGKRKIKDVWPWTKRTMPLTKVAKHLSGLLSKSIRTIKDWSSNYEWTKGTGRPDDRSKAVAKEHCLKTLREMQIID